jgi:very-short-patch-repair endonuclease
MPVPDGPIAIEVLVPGESAPRRPGIRIRRAGALLPRDLARIRGVPVTSPARTIRDLGNVLGREHLERVFADAQRRKLVRGGQLVDQLRRSRGGRGTATLRSLVEADAEPLLTASEAEVRMLAALRTAELPAPECNAYVGGYKVDFVWRDTALIVEVDGYAFHADRHAFEADRLRDAELGDLGFRVIRVTWRQLVDRPQMVVARVRRAHRRRVLRREE